MYANRRLKMMGTVIDIAICSHQADKQLKEVVEQLTVLKNRFSANDDDSELMAVNHSAGKIEQADGVIIGTPEYDHSIPAVLMNALAWLSYDIYPLLNKPIMITGASLSGCLMKPILLKINLL